MRYVHARMLEAYEILLQDEVLYIANAHGNTLAAIFRKKHAFIDQRHRRIKTGTFGEVLEGILAHEEIIGVDFEGFARSCLVEDQRCTGTASFQFRKFVRHVYYSVKYYTRIRFGRIFGRKYVLFIRKM